MQFKQSVGLDAMPVGLKESLNETRFQPFPQKSGSCLLFTGIPGISLSNAHVLSIPGIYSNFLIKMQDQGLGSGH